MAFNWKRFWLVLSKLIHFWACPKEHCKDKTEKKIHDSKKISNCERRKTSTEHSKLHFMCPEEQLGHFLLNKTNNLHFFPYFVQNFSAGAV